MSNLDLVEIAIQKYNESIEDEDEPQIKEGDELFGNYGILDSIAILDLITLLEEEIESSTGKSVMLYDRYSEYTDAVEKEPFKNTEALKKYTEWVLSTEE